MCLDLDCPKWILVIAWLYRRFPWLKRTWYKVYAYKRGDYLKSPYMQVSAEAGVVQSNRPCHALMGFESKWGEINKGIHVFAFRRAARRMASSIEKADRFFIHKTVVMPVTATRPDLVAIGQFGWHASAVFMKVEIAKADYDKALKEAKE